MCVRMPPTGQRTATSTRRVVWGRLSACQPNGRLKTCPTASGGVASCVDIAGLLQDQGAGGGGGAADQLIKGAHTALGGEARGAGSAALGHHSCRLGIVENPADGVAQAGGVAVID